MLSRRRIRAWQPSPRLLLVCMSSATRLMSTRSLHASQRKLEPFHYPRFPSHCLCTGMHGSVHHPASWSPEEFHPQFQEPGRIHVAFMDSAVFRRSIQPRCDQRPGGEWATTRQGNKDAKQARFCKLRREKETHWSPPLCISAATSESSSISFFDPPGPSLAGGPFGYSRSASCGTFVVLRS